MTDANEDLVRQGYAAFAEGDMDTLRSLFAPDAVHVATGNSQVAGEYRGVDAILGYYGTLFELSDGTFVITATEGDFGFEELPPQIRKVTVPRETAALELLKRHRDRVASAVAQTQSTVVSIGTVEEHGQSWVRHTKIVRAFREKIGFAFTEKEQREITESTAPHHREMAQPVLDTMRTLDDDRKKRAS